MLNIENRKKKEVDSRLPPACERRGVNLKVLYFLHESQFQNLAVTVLFVPSLLDSGMPQKSPEEFSVSERTKEDDRQR